MATSILLASNFVILTLSLEEVLASFVVVVVLVSGIVSGSIGALLWFGAFLCRAVGRFWVWIVVAILRDGLDCVYV